MGIVLNYCQYGVLYLGSYYNTGPYIHFPHFGYSDLGKLPYVGLRNEGLDYPISLLIPPKCHEMSAGICVASGPRLGFRGGISTRGDYQHWY